jgi:3-oxoacyl-[acyl-carrier protein] reductase
MIDLKGKRALVTGGSRGIGAATSRLLAQCGADVAISYRSRAAPAQALVHDLQHAGVRSFAVPVELSERDSVEAMYKRLDREFGGLDIFIGNAGIWPVEEAAVTAMSDDRWRRTMAENNDGMFYSTRGALQRLAPGGRVVLVASTAGQRGEAMHADYAATKGAMISFVKSVAIEVARNGITVNGVAPGWVDTEMCAEVFANGGKDRIASTIPVGRIATPDDIAAPIVFLCSEHARHITGEILNVNGGSVLCG